MAKKHVIDGNSTATINITHGDGTWIIKHDAVVDVDSGTAISNEYQWNNNHYIIEGDIGASGTTMWAGVNDAGRNTTVEIGKDGLVHADIGVFATGDGLDILNDGNISGISQGITLYGGDFFLRNSGSISASDSDGFAFYVSKDSAYGHIVNQKDGVIDGHVYINSSQASTIINRGEILDSGAQFDVSMGDGNDRFVNSGTVGGGVYLGDGNDVADLRNGSVGTSVWGWTGDDTFIINSTDHAAYEFDGEGTDTIKSSVSFSAMQTVVGEIENFTAIGKAGITLVGNALDNIMRGNAGKNTLDGMTGDDDLFGGKGKDLFNFTTGHGSDRIMDFQDGKDRIMLSGWANDFDDVTSRAEQVGKNVVLSYGDDHLTLRHTDLADLDASDFIF